MSELVNNIKMLKLFGWENILSEKINVAHESEAELTGQQKWAYTKTEAYT